MRPVSDLSDSVLVERIRGGDEDAFALLFDRYADAIRRRAAGWMPGNLQRKVSVADVVQETRIIAFERMADFEHRGEGSFRNWVLRIAQLRVRNLLQHYGGTAKRDLGHEVTRARRGETAAHAARDPTPSQLVMARELEELARRAMEMLPEDHREVLRLVRDHDLELRVVATRMSRSYEATKKLHGRALYKFTELFESLRRAYE